MGGELVWVFDPIGRSDLFPRVIEKMGALENLHVRILRKVYFFLRVELLKEWMIDAIVEPIWEVEKKKKKKRNAHASGPVTGAGRVGQSQ